MPTGTPGAVLLGEWAGSPVVWKMAPERRVECLGDIAVRLLLSV